MNINSIKNSKQLKIIFNLIMIVLVLILIFSLLSIYNKNNRSTAIYDGSETRTERILSVREQSALNAEPRIIERESNEFRELRRLCSREQSGVISYESNYCERFKELQSND